MKRKGTITPDEVLKAKDINSFQKVLLAYFINREENYEDNKEPTQQEIADDLGVTVITICKSLNDLVSKGYLTVKNLKAYNNRFRNFYKINWDRIKNN